MFQDHVTVQDFGLEESSVNENRSIFNSTLVFLLLHINIAKRDKKEFTKFKRLRLFPLRQVYVFFKAVDKN